jgi:Fe-S cluster biosynthesis and repair protein YggX
VRCIRLGRELPGLPAPPFPTELGQRLYDQVSIEAWGQWLAHSKMLVNEYRLNLSTPEARRFLMEQCDKFFFGEGSAPPPEYAPPPGS